MEELKIEELKMKELKIEEKKAFKMARKASQLKYQKNGKAWKGWRKASYAKTLKDALELAKKAWEKEKNAELAAKKAKTAWEIAKKIKKKRKAAIKKNKTCS